MDDFAANPYSAPLAPPLAKAFDADEATALRRGHLRRETALRLFGLFLLSFSLFLSLVLVAAFAELRWDWKLDSRMLLQLAGALTAGLQVLLGFQGGWRLLFLDARGRWTAFATTLILLIFYGYRAKLKGAQLYVETDLADLIAIGGLLSLFGLCLIVGLVMLGSPKSGFLFSAEYGALCRATPQMRWWKTPLGGLGLFGFLVWQTIVVAGLLMQS